MTTDTQTPNTSTSATLESYSENPATAEALRHLADKLEPLIQGQRLDHLVDLASLLSDLVDMTDERMVEKTMRSWEELIAVGWTTGNAIRFAGNQIEQQQHPPTLLQLMKQMNDPDVRRGLAFILAFTGVIGRQLRHD